MSDKKQNKRAGAGARRSETPKPGGGAPGHERDQVDLFIEEVTEELQKERAYKLFRRYGPFVGGAVVAIVLAASINEYLKSAATHEAREAGAALIAAGDVSSEPAAAADAYEEAAGRLEGGPALLARLHVGALRAEAGEAEAAGEAFDAASGAAADQPVYADLAALRAVMARFDAIEADRAVSDLEPLAAEGRPFRPLALELLGLAELKAGRVPEARARLEEAFAAWSSSDAARLRERDVAAARRRLTELLEGLAPDASGEKGDGPGEDAAEPATSG